MPQASEGPLDARSPAQLKSDWAALRASEPDLRARELARRLGVSEGELVACRTGDNVTRLKNGSSGDIFRALPTSGA